MKEFLLFYIVPNNSSKSVRKLIEELEALEANFFQSDIGDRLSENESSIQRWFKQIEKILKILKRSKKFQHEIATLTQLKKTVIEKIYVAMKLESGSRINQFLIFYKWVFLYGTEGQKLKLKNFSLVEELKNPLSPLLTILCTNNKAILMPSELAHFYPKKYKFISWLFRGRKIREEFFQDKQRAELLFKLKWELDKGSSNLNNIDLIEKSCFDNENFQDLMKKLECENKKCNEQLGKIFWWQNKAKKFLKEFSQFIYQNQIRLLYKLGSSLLKSAKALKLIADIGKRAQLESMIGASIKEYTAQIAKIKEQKRIRPVELEKELELMPSCIENELLVNYINNKITEEDYQALLLKLEQGLSISNPQHPARSLSFNLQTKLISQLIYTKKADCLKYSVGISQFEKIDLLATSINNIWRNYLYNLASSENNIFDGECTLTHQENFLHEIVSLMQKIKLSEQFSLLLEKLEHCKTLRAQGVNNFFELRQYAQESLGMPILENSKFTRNKRSQQYLDDCQKIGGRKMLFFSEKTIRGDFKISHLFIKEL